jgi:CubicO group peptidase (beta-lactamase class C family)
MPRRLIALLLARVLAGCSSSDSPVAQTPLPDGPPALRMAERARRAASLPAVAVVIVRGDSAPDIAVRGVRRAAGADTVSPRDRFHLGSNTKAITATLAAILVHDGLLSWDLTLGAAFPDDSAQMDIGYRRVTLRQLLAHEGGAPEFTSPEELTSAPAFSGDARTQRRQFARWLTQRSPASRVGAFSYSNAGYGLAAAMLEARAGRDWESLLRERLFRPLGISDDAVSVGWPGLAGAGEPWGHVGESGRWSEHAPTDGRIVSLPPIIAPAGDLSMRPDAYARFLQLHLRGLAGRDDVLPAAAIRALHPARPAGAYAFGWIAARLGSDTAFAHEGSAGTFHAITVLVPQRNAAVLVVTNAGGDDAADAIRDAALTLP